MAPSSSDFRFRYVYRSRVGTFEIRPRPDEEYPWWLFVDGSYLGRYLSPELAADEVYMQHTDFDAWDDLPPVTSPADLSEWDRLPIHD